MTSVVADSRAQRIRADLEPLLAHDERMWQSLRGARVLLTGGTGFFGQWLLESFAHANERLALGARVVVLSRDPDAFARRNPRLHAASGVEWHRGDVRDFTLPGGEYTHAIHAAADLGRASTPTEVFDGIVLGTRRVLAACAERGIPDLLLVSSGAVYGAQPRDLARIGEGFEGAPLVGDVRDGYGHGKRCAEWMALAHAAEGGPAPRIARCFAFVGPYLPLDGAFAVGNFIGDRLAGREILVKGDGTAVRTYLYAADLARWLWTVLLRGRAGEAYNVGSEEAVSVAELARRIAAVDGAPGATRVLGAPVHGLAAGRYVPDTARARGTLGLSPTTGLDEALRRTLAWHRLKDTA